MTNAEQTARRVPCDGSGSSGSSGSSGGEGLGHPLVWYDVSGDEEVQCQYCGRILSAMPDSDNG